MGERTVVEAVSSKFADTAALTNGDETTTGSPGCEDVKDDVPYVAVLETGAEETSIEERATARLLLICLAVIMSKMTERQKKRNN